MTDAVRRLVAVRRELRFRREIASTPRAFALVPRNADLLRKLYDWTISEVRTLHRTEGLPLKVLGEGHRRRYIFVPAAVDRWLMTRGGGDLG